MKYALVTGSAKGIGRSIAEELAKRNYNLLLVDVDESGLRIVSSNLKNTYNTQVEYLQIDLAIPAAGKKIFEWSSPWHNDLEIVVNNAAFGLNGAFAELSLDEQLDIVNVNVKAVVEICHRFIPVLIKKEKTYLLNIGSNAAYQAVPYLCMYAASKSFIVSFTRGIRYELRKTNISVTCVSPGSTDTNFVDRAGMGKSIRRTAEKYNLTPQKVARLGVDALFKGKSEILTGFNTKLGVFLSGIAPKIISETFGANIFQKKN
ncbi:MAG: NAD(P)-dependent oxidoreductase [Bacteroidetes bacterium]|nr:MAG: NAD(P)-dependent oxidoreductase [Bacteroidota bacterium]